MNNNLTELVFILDRSGSMSGLEADTIGGFNSMLARQKEEEGEAVISTVLFDNHITVLHNRESIGRVEKLTSKDYFVGGSTALLDAVGSAVHHIGSVHDALPKDERPAKTMFIITTDGFENSSREYTYENVRNLITKMQKKRDWEFLFLGANMDAISAAADIGIRADRSVNFHCDAEGTAVNYAAISNTISKYRAAEAKECKKALNGWSRDIEADFKRRK